MDSSPPSAAIISSSTAAAVVEQAIKSSDDADPPAEKVSNKSGVVDDKVDVDVDIDVDDEVQKTTTTTTTTADDAIPAVTISSEIKKEQQKEKEKEKETAGDSEKKEVTDDTKTAELLLLHDDDICKFRVSDIRHSSERAEDFDVLLLPSVHGLYDLVEAVFQQSLAELTDDHTRSRMWTIEYGSETYVNILDDHTVREYEYEKKKKPVLCDRLHQCIGFASAPLDNNDNDNSNGTIPTRGAFRFDHRPVEFRFVLLETTKMVVNNATDNDDDDDDDDDDNNNVIMKEQYPKCIPTEYAIQWTADVGATDYVSQSQEAKIQQLSESFVTFFRGPTNSWSENQEFDLERHEEGDNDYDTDEEPYLPAKPISPQYARIEYEIIGLFINAGWKFANSYKSGLKYAMPHRAKAGLQMKWYELAKKSHFMVESYGKRLSNDRKIILAKKLCKELMEEMLEHHDRRNSNSNSNINTEPIVEPIPRPKKRTRKQMQIYGDRDRYDSRTAVELRYLPKRLRSRHSSGSCW